ncbi:DUF2459 domain-containing protein [Methylococcus sp. EFPC2]|uniref:DUF2459 domain-containing protein n=1 Tax=Methylococcus sp. EFPC2 TaxID=2812648 RepID=UPI00196707FA|nr:DUF2459 domain-containing protein [Methylococcus sp. EFPC2]QSA98284.1 DUF2459 domain-containing protein [Methylococcus sp. EFPC2]
MNGRFALFVIALGLLPMACAGPTDTGRVQAEPYASVYVVNHGYHSGLVIDPADLPAGKMPESADFPNADYLELGWGDRDYYRADDPGFGAMLQAAFWSDASVLHVIGVYGSIRQHYGGRDIVRLSLTAQGYAGLADYIHQSFVREGAARVGPIGPGLIRNSYFYPARGHFSLLNTCNAWTARALEAGAYPMGFMPLITAHQLMNRIRPFAVPESRPQP